MKNKLKRFTRLVGLAVLVGGWSLAGASLYVIKTPGHLVILPKDRLGYHDTFVNTRNWTLNDVRAHPAVTARLLHLNRLDLLSNVVDPTNPDAQAQLADAISHPTYSPATQPSAMIERVKADVHSASETVKSVFD